MAARLPLLPTRRLALRTSPLARAGAPHPPAACAPSAAFASAAHAQATISTGRGCYLVGKTVQLSGQGFSPSHTYVVTLDGVLLGERATDAQGSLAITVHPGGLPAGTAQHVDHIRVDDGTTTAMTFFTVTRSAGAGIFTSGSTPATLQASFHVWGFSLGGTPRPVYVHYVEPSGHQRARTFLGRTDGQCGWISTPRRKLFPFSVSPGNWTLQVDTQKALADQLEGTVRTDQAQIENAKLQIVYCHITAPFDGRVGLRQVDPGNIVHASDQNGIVIGRAVSKVYAKALGSR